MAPADLPKFLPLLEAAGALRRISTSVDPVLEVAAIVDRVVRRPGGGPALLFERVTGSDFPLITNLYGSGQRMAAALGHDSLEAASARIASALAATPEGLPAWRLVQACASYPPRSVAAAGLSHVVDPPDLGILPALHSWPDDGGRFLTLAQVFTRHPETLSGNCGLYRVQIFNRTTAAVHFHPGAGGGEHWRAWQQQGKRMPVVLALGGAPALTWAASAPLPRGVDELAMVGLVTGNPVLTTVCDSCDLEVPASAEFILEGYLAPGEFRPEGPFGNHTGYYAPAAPASVFHLLSLRRRPHPLYPCTVVGPPPRENYWLAKASERLLLPLLRLEVPEVVELHFLPAGIFHRAALVSVSGGEGPDLLHRLRQTPLLRGSRLLVLFDADDDLHDGSRLLWLLLNQASPGRDWLLSEGGIGIDARRRERPLSARVAVDPATAALVARRWGEYGID